jgi:protein arginine kinase
MINQADSELEPLLDFAFHPKLGYLTACPTNVGTGMRASAMLHLPGLVMSDQMNKIINSVNKIGLAVRGLHGEGSEAMGNLFQVSNQITLGETEDEIIERLKKVIETIIEHEQNARLLLLQRKPVQAQKMSAEERDALRANLIRAKLKGVPEPDTTKITIKPSGSQENDE